MSKRFLNTFWFQRLCFDKSITLYSGKPLANWYIKGMPTQFGYKPWWLNTNIGYLIKSDPDAGIGDRNAKRCGSIVTRLS